MKNDTHWHRKLFVNNARTVPHLPRECQPSSTTGAERRKDPDNRGPYILIKNILQQRESADAIADLRSHDAYTLRDPREKRD